MTRTVQRRLISVMLAVMLCAASSGLLHGETTAQPQLFQQNPCISPDGKTVAFDYRGDIWTVPIDGGVAKCLTIHMGVEKRPNFSPDGKWIIYSADYYGNLDLYVIPFEGGIPRRLTYSAGNDLASSFSQDGKYVYFYSYLESRFDIFRIPFTGGTPVRIVHSTRDSVYAPSISSDGKKMAFTYRSSHYYMKRSNNRTYGNAEIFVADNTAPATNIKRVTNNKFPDYLPTWKPGTQDIYFVSERDGHYNLYLKAVDETAKPKQITNFTSSIRWYSVAAQTGDIVVSMGYRLYRVDAAGTAKLLEAKCFSPAKTTEREFVQSKTVISDFSLSPDGEKIAYICGNDVFIMSSKGGYAKRITDTVEREIHLSWSVDSLKVLFNRIEDGKMRVFTQDITQTVAEKIGEGDFNFFTPHYSPDGKQIFFQKNYDELCSMSATGTDIKTLTKGVYARYLFSSGPFFTLPGDGKMLFFQENNDIMSYDIKVKNLDTSEEPVRISIEGKSSYFGDMSFDKRFVCYTNYENKGEIWCIDFGFTPEKRTSPIEKLEGLLTEDDGDGAKKPAKAEKKVYVPDFTQLEKSTKLACKSFKLPHSSPILLPKSYNMLFIAGETNKEDLYIVNLASSSRVPRKLTSFGKAISGVEVNSKGTVCYFSSKGQLFSCSLKTGKVASLLPPTYSKIVNQTELRKTVFNEALWFMETGFYDPNLHGVSIKDLKSRYIPLLSACRTYDEYSEIMSDMTMEFNASHMGITIKNPNASLGISSEPQLHYGFFLDNALLSKGIFKVSKIIADTPASKDGSGLVEGDFITHINNIPLSEDVNIFKLLRSTLSGELKLQITDDESGANSRVVYLPIISLAAFRAVVLNDWEKSNRDYISKISDGKIGYVLIRRMYDADYDLMVKFLKRYLPSKDAVVLDFRYNGGGRISHKIAEILDDSPWIYKKMRGGKWLSEDNHRDFSWQKPTAGLFNYSSASNAEMMLSAFRIKKLGPSVGLPTAGGVIGTYSRTLADGSSMRLPRFAVYDLEGRNLELSPTEPEFFVDRTVAHDMSGEFPHLDKAVEELKEILSKKTTEIDVEKFGK